jgi:protein PhnA
MSIEQELRERSGSACELCGGADSLQPYAVSHAPAGIDANVLLCMTCLGQVTTTDALDANHWRCLNTSMWSTVPAVQVMAWRLLNRLQREGQSWAQDLLDMLYLDEETLAWAKAGRETDDSAPEEKVIHKDSNGTVLQSGDTVVLIKDLDVKGGGFTAKRGTAVRGISLVEDHAGQIEGRVNGQQIVILTQYVKKSS